MTEIPDTESVHDKSRGDASSLFREPMEILARLEYLPAMPTNTVPIRRVLRNQRC